MPIAWLGRLVRLYLAWYRLEHDLSLWRTESYYALQVTLTPPTPRQALWLENVLPEGVWQEAAGTYTLQTPLERAVREPDFEDLLGFVENQPGLRDTRLEFQLLIAPGDAAFSPEFNLREGWDWLRGASRLTELVVAGKVVEHKVLLGRLFHSCYRTGFNRDVSTSLPRAVDSWLELRRRVARLWLPGGGTCRLACRDRDEAEQLAALCRRLEADRERSVEPFDALESRLTPDELADLLCHLRIGRGLGLFRESGRPP